MADDDARLTNERDYTGPGWFWTQAEWAEWSNTLALLLPEGYDDDVAQEAIIERAVMDMATQIREAQAVLTEYEDAGRLPAPYTNERALYERICSALGRESIEPSLALGDRFRAARDECPLGKAVCDPLANGCDGECETEWQSYTCTAGNHARCSGAAWQPDIACECKCHVAALVSPPAKGASDD